MTNIKNIIFDLDNTLWDFSANSKDVLVYMHQEFGLDKYIPFDTFYSTYSQINEGYWEQFSRGEITKTQLLQNRFVETFKQLDIDKLEIADLFRQNYLGLLPERGILIPGAEEVLKYLKSKEYKIIILTNGFKEVSHKKVNNSVLKNYCDVLVTSDDINIQKPNPAIFEYCLQQSQATIKNSIMIGDNWEADILGGLNFGLQTIFFNPIGIKKETVKNCIEIQSLTELLSVL